MAAKAYTSVDDFYNEAIRDECHQGSTMKESFWAWEATADSSVRNEISGTMQWFRDNGCDVGDDFFNTVKGQGKLDGLNDIEICSIGLMMQDITAMMNDGRITADDAKTYMERLTDPAMIEDIKNGGRGDGEKTPFQDLAYDMARDLENAPNTEVAGKNVADMSEPRRAVINDQNDYLTAYAERNPDNPDPYDYMLASPDAAIDDINAMITEQEKAGNLTRDESRDVAERLAAIAHNNMNPNPTRDMAIVAMAMREAIDSGDPELIDKVMNGDFIQGVVDQNEDSLAILDDVNKTASGVGVSDKQAESEEKQTEEAEPEDKETTTPADTSARIDGTIVIGMFKGDEGYADPDAVLDDMTAGYFEDENNIPFDQYVNMENDYEALSERAQEAYLEKHPEFKEAREFMDGTSALYDDLKEMVADGKTSDEIGQYLTESGYREEFTESAMNVVTGIGREDPYEAYAREEAEKEAATPADAEQPDTAQKSHGDETYDYERIKGAASGIWRGDYGSGDARDEAMQEAGYTADEIALAQSVVNQGYGFTYSMDETAFNEVVEAYGELKQSPDYEEGDKLKCGVVNGETYHAEKQAERAASQETQQEEEVSDGATLSGSVSDEAQAEQEQPETETASAEKLQYVTDVPESRAEAKPEEDYDFSV